MKLDSSGNAFPFASGLNQPIGLALDSSGNLYVANSVDHKDQARGSEFDTSGNESLFALLDASPLGLAFDSNGNLFVSTAGDRPGTIVKIDPSGQGTVFASTGLNVPQGLAFDSSGNL